MNLPDPHVQALEVVQMAFGASRGADQSIKDERTQLKAQRLDEVCTVIELWEYSVATDTASAWWQGPGLLPEDRRLQALEGLRALSLLENGTLVRFVAEHSRSFPRSAARLFAVEALRSLAISYLDLHAPHVDHPV